MMGRTSQFRNGINNKRLSIAIHWALAACLLLLTNTAYSQEVKHLMGVPGTQKRDLCKPGQYDLKQLARAVVEEVVDGDTFNVTIGTKSYNVRVLSVDTPETHFQGKSQGYWGERAHQYLASLLKVGDTVSLEFDRESCDSYGRLLAYVWKGKQFINRQILEAGMAVNYCIYPNDRYCRQFSRVIEPLEQDANKGIWGDPSVEIPYVWRVKTEGRKFTKPVGDIFDGQIYGPNAINRISVSHRIFFFKPEDIRTPYRYME